MHKHHQQGIALIELLVVLLLASWVSTWGAAQWQQRQQRLRLEHTTRQLFAFLIRLQADTNWRNRTALLWFQPGERWCLGSGNKAVNCAQKEGWIFIPEYNDVQLHSYTHKEMGFYGVRNNAQAGHILLANGAGEVFIILSAKGRLRICVKTGQLQGFAQC